MKALFGLVFLVFVVILGTGFYSSSAGDSESVVADPLADIAWIAGAWAGKAGPASIEEHWIPPAGGTMFGINRTVAGSKTVAFEFLRIVSRKDGVFYIAHPNASKGTEFKLTKKSATEVVFENPEHDFPQIIRYRLGSDGGLTAEIEGMQGDRRAKQAFPFKPIKSASKSSK